MITFTPRRRFSVPVDAGIITPDALASKTMDEINAFPVFEGNRRRKVAELFRVECDAASSDDATVRLVGDLTHLKRVGANMSCGRILVEGSVGMRLGENLQGGLITVTGDADSWIGTRMKGGRIEVLGRGGDYLGAAYRGSAEGMEGGTIVIHGDAGNEVGCFMRHGLIQVHGNIGSFAGIHMGEGTILVEGDSAGRLGAQMRGGKIVVLGQAPSILPTFTIDSLRRSVRVGEARLAGPFYLFNGDLAEMGAGRLYVSQAMNPHLHVFEKYLPS